MSVKNIISKINIEGKTAVVSAIVGLYWIVEGFKLGYWGATSPGPGFFPIFAGVLTVFFSAFVFKQSLNKKNDNKVTSSALKWLFIIPLIALIIVFAMDYIGTMLSLTIFFLFWFKKMESFTWKKTILLTLGIMGVIYAVFVLWLMVPFPKFFGLF